ncbi:LysR family transcriptional regulator [Paenirhodobacter populi]|uniref:LysR family transcriptional regulator n=1 Tax=Paenirhodobacter populi TaxID=2306993 RepID=UPI001F4D9921|nr:LysR family transcriptional regulator [Sinirhodobacter populi]
MDQHLEDRKPPVLLGSRIPLAALIQTLAVAEHLNFRHAANALGVNQSTVSTRIKMLEEDLGILLFERRPRGVRLTEAGRHFVEEIAAGIGHLDHAIKTVSAVVEGKTGQLSIGLHSPVAFGFLADLRRRYRQTWPGVDLITVEGRSGEAIRQVLDGSLDIAFVVGRPETPQCHTRMLWTEPMVIALAATHPLASGESVTWSDLSAETFLVRHAGAGAQVHEHVVRRATERALPPRIRRCDVERDTLMHMVAEGEGVTLTCASFGRIPFPGVCFMAVADEPEPARYSALWSPHNHNPALRDFIDLATKMRQSTRYA